MIIEGILLYVGLFLVFFKARDVMKYVKETRDFKVIYAGLFIFVVSLLISFLIKNLQYGYGVHFSTSNCFFGEVIFIAAILGYLELMAVAVLGKISMRFNMAVYVSICGIFSLWGINAFFFFCY